MCNRTSYHWETSGIPNLILQFDQYLQDYKNLSPSTIKNNHVYLNRFFNWFCNLKPPTALYNLDAVQLKLFLDNYHSAYSASSTRKLHFVLRSFFKYSLLYGCMQNDFYPLLPLRRVYSKSHVPGVLSNSDLQELINAAQKDDSDKGKRDYALLPLLVCYGVRGIQVRKLRLNDIDWRNCFVYFRGVKNGNDLKQPLIPEVGNALSDYITKVRPRVNGQIIFLSLKPPNEPLNSSSGLSSIISKLLNKCNIQLSRNSRRGTHILRHTFASRLLLQGVPMKNISDMLGHKFYDTTVSYTKIDTLRMKKICLEWEDKAI